MTRELDSIIRTHEALNAAVDRLSRDQLKALAERLGYHSTRRGSDELRRAIRRRLVGAR